MPEWTLILHPDAAAELAALPEKEYARIERALLQLAEAPFRARPGVDVRKLKRVPGGMLLRLRVGERRALYAALTGARTLVVLVVERRGLGYARLLRMAEGRLP